jgi:hypothetical protein
MRPRDLIPFVCPLLAGAVLMACEDDRHPTAPTTDPPALRHAAQGSAAAFTDEFHLERCTFAATGRNPFFILEPGYTQVLEGTEDGATVALTIRVLDATEDVGGVTTRIVEERHVEDGELVEVSRNFFALCEENGSVFYFGEEVDIFEEGEIVSHEGAWRHGARGARAGLIMPGIALLGARYFQEVAPGVALDRAEIIELDATVRTPLRRFTDVLVTRETTPLEPGVTEFKSYAPGVGLVADGEVLLVSAGFGSPLIGDAADRNGEVRDADP